MSNDGTKINVAKRIVEKSVYIEYIKTLFYFEFNDKFQDRFEEHAEWEMVYVDRGECTVIADDESFTLCQGEMYFHRPFEKHKILFLFEKHFFKFSSSIETQKLISSF